MRPTPPQDPATRYGCQEFREDSERCITGRADEALRLRYESHRLECADCRRFHQRLALVYEGPRYPVDRDEAAQELEFQAILDKTQSLKEQSQSTSSSALAFFEPFDEESDESDWQVGRKSGLKACSEAIAGLTTSLRPVTRVLEDGAKKLLPADELDDLSVEDTQIWSVEDDEAQTGVPLWSGVGNSDANRHRRSNLRPVISGSAAVLAVGALVVGFQFHSSSVSDAPVVAEVSGVEAREIAATKYPSAVIPTSKTELEHRSQRFGRVIRGEAEFGRNDGRVASAGAFRVGTTIESHAGQSVQFALSGKMLVSMTDEARVRWSHASADSIQLEVDHGTIAVRYDRQVGEPTLLVRTPKTLVRVTGTVFTVQAHEGGEASVAVLRGKVEVRDSMHPNARVAKVANGFRYDSKTGDLAPLGAHEVKAALPLSDFKDGRSPAGLRKAQEVLIPSSWHVPGLPKDPERRTLSQISRSERSSTGRASRSTARRRAKKAASQLRNLRKKQRSSAKRTQRSSNGWGEERMIQDLMDQAVESINAYQDAAISQQIAAAQKHCNELYNNSATRFNAASCLQGILDRYPNHPRARSEALVAIGILRMDYARDYQRAILAFRSFLKDYGDDPRAELVSYRLVLAHVEYGDVQAAYGAARRYVQRYPNGAHLGHILQRFPELKSLL